MNIFLVFCIAVFLFFYNVIFVGKCYHCKKIVFLWSDYYIQKTDIENMYLSKNKNYGSPYHKKCCHDNEPNFCNKKWDTSGFKVI